MTGVLEHAPDRAVAAELGPELTQVRGVCRELARDLRSRALAVDADPHDNDLLLASPTLALLRAASTPRRFRAAATTPFAAEYTESCLARVVANLELARGDAAVLNANTGPSLAGLAVDALGSGAQQELFYAALADNRTWTFFGMTEADRGSDATAMTTRLDRTGTDGSGPDGGWRLHGTKRYVAGAARAGIGVVFARTGPTALSIRAALVRSAVPGFAAHPLPMLGLRGAGIGEMSFRGVEVAPDMLLGAHLPASRRGLWGAGRAFNVMRVQISAQALGLAFAVHDLVREQRPGWAGLDLPAAHLHAARDLLHAAADDVDRDPDDRRRPSIAKLHVTDLAVRTTRWAEGALGPASLLDHPLLEKWCRDVYSFEFMDGTSNILRLHVAPNPSPRSSTPPREGS